MPRPNQFTNPWTDEHKEFLKKHYGDMPVGEIAKILGHSKKSVQSVASNLDLTRNWTDEEEQFVIDNYEKYSYSYIGRRLKRTTSSVTQRASHLGLKKAIQGAWKPDEIKFLKDNFNKMTYEEMRIVIKRSLPAIYNKAHELGLSSNDAKYSKLKFDQRQFIINNCHRMSDAELALKFQVSVEAVMQVRKKNGIKKTGQQTSKMTLPERITADILNSLNIKYEFNISVDRFSADFLLESGKIIEVQGDYYHCNPKLYPNGPDEKQIDYIVRDYYKKCFYFGNGYNVLYIWEDDIVNRVEETKEEIKQFISAV